jgi:hypothetical protein
LRYKQRNDSRAFELGLKFEPRGSEGSRLARLYDQMLQSKQPLPVAFRK